MKKYKTRKVPNNEEITEEFLADAIREYQAEALLNKIYELQYAIFLDKNKVGAALVRNARVVLDGEIVDLRIMITPWDLHDLSYYTILNTHDKRGTKDISDNDIYYLLDIVKKYNEKKLDFEEQDFKLLLFGMMGEQFKYQDFSTLEHICRENYILFECSKKVDSSFDLERIYEEKVGIDWRKVTTFLLLGILNNNGEIKLEYKNVLRGETIDIRDLINKYTVSYNQVKESAIERQLFYVKPFVKTQSGNTIQISPFFTRYITEHCNLWQLRDAYRNEPTTNFPSFFGECFECYLNELFEEYIPNSFERIVREEDEKRADWRIKLGEYDILVEQKSAILRMDIKQQNSNIKNLKDYLKSNIISAMEQLHSTENFFGKKFIKIILLYDDYLETEILDEVFKMKECTIENDNHYWLINIREFEMLMDTFQNDVDLFNEIMEEKKKREREESPHGKSIRKLFEEKNKYEDKYLEKEKFKKYKYEQIAKDCLEWS